MSVRNLNCPITIPHSHSHSRIHTQSTTVHRRTSSGAPTRGITPPMMDPPKQSVWHEQFRCWLCHPIILLWLINAGAGNNSVSTALDWAGRRVRSSEVCYYITRQLSAHYTQWLAFILFSLHRSVLSLREPPVWAPYRAGVRPALYLYWCLMK